MGLLESRHNLPLLLWPLVALVIAVLVIRLVSTAKDLADLISAFASLTWPLVALAIVSWFRPELRVILLKLRKGKLLGQEFELTELEARTEAAEKKVEERSAEELSDEAAPNIAQDAVEEVLQEASRSPRLGLMLLSAKIERAARELAVDTGVDVSHRPVSISPMIRSLVQAEQLPFEAAEALNLFNQVRNRIVHGRDADDDEVARAIDSGTRLLRLLLSRPRPSSQCPC